MNISITGATGFIGGKLLKKLSEENHNIKCLVRKTSSLDNLKNLGAEKIYGDLGDFSSFESLVKGSDTIFHLAAFVSDFGRKDDFFKYNYEATRHLLDQSVRQGVKKFIYLSTSSVLWRSDFWDVHRILNIDESYPYPDSYNDFYNESKSLAEKLVISYNGKDGLQTTVIRPSGVWGAGDTVILPRIIKAAEKGFLIPAGDGKGLVSPCHIDNLVDGTVLASITDKSSGKIYFINDGNSINHIEFITMLLNASGIDWSPKLFIPYKLGYSIASLLELSHRIAGMKKPPVITRFAVAAIAGSRTYSIEKAKKDLSYSPKVGLEQGLSDLSKWVDSLGGYKKLMAK
ncbi:MAG: NAD-dependent epimerase/dehydratase family protein [Candidatus Dadabacteria bacterium]|nr:NAD-dependent epimerase/dehydratase family protein [Candidatus Dadabacteria bacterium]NIS08758.1 NAD-dependent epimerase/dehydratase family protein [Candidatus Dadabacteria bacterium]NIV42701.1 NAD-dependent epimerase/dehydratase family protein [Candidatus Dadabacteria bacterium]NIX15444.1 NAD-dependent epimerase/dehydratase family protein [Candidatus Dadabacteria bacterium]NIY22106.1 NAD-dependent epimerase/dehydratase family protein [Candidatus Dadabacteria bacterium]